MLLYVPTLLAMLALCCVTAYKPEVKVSAGTFRGKILTSQSGASYASYRGIPYALPPTGERRFALPVRHPIIGGVHDAEDFGPICLQNVGDIMGQEDCLYLNVYTPLNEKETPATDLKKVFVFIHGGGLVIGSSNPYLPGDFVTRSKVIVVTMNYRLGWLGFLRGNSSSLPGNQGIWDMLMALQWVHDNIRYFGGDPEDITLSGESAGSMSTSVLSVSPLSKNLFSKALLLSGVALLFPAFHHTSNDLLQSAASKFGCRVDQVDGNEHAIANCLTKIPAVNFVSQFDLDELANVVSSGDDIAPRSLAVLLNDSGYLEDVGFYSRDYLASVTADDGYIVINAGFGKVDTTSVDTAVKGIWWLNFPVSVTKLVILEYLKIYGDLDKSVIALATDYLFIEKSLIFIEAYSNRPQQRDSSTKGNAYLMSFDHAPKYVPNHYMLHALDLVYLFDLNPKEFARHFYFLELEDVFYDEDIEMKSLFIDLVTDFMKTGNPGEKLSTQNNFAWHPYESLKKTYLSLSLQPSVGEDIFSNRRAIWQTLIPQWLQEYQLLESREEL